MKKIQIKTPCTENWDKMTPDEKGRFCELCQHSVVDFTTMENNEILDFFKHKSQNKICGRFQKTQLDLINLTGKEPRQRSNFIGKLFFGLSFGIWLAAGPVEARSILGSDLYHIQLINRDFSEGRNDIKGLVLTDLGEPLFNATVYLYEENELITMSKTDKNGKFIFSGELFKEGKKYSIGATLAGYYYVQHSFYGKRKELIKIGLAQKTEEEVNTSKENWNKKMKINNIKYVYTKEDEVLMGFIME